MPGAGSKVQFESERPRLAPPAPDRGQGLRLQLPLHIQECRSTRPAVQVLVGAADGKVRAALVQRDRHGPTEWLRSQSTRAPAACARR